MDAFSERRGTLIALGLVILVTTLVGLSFMGGQTSKILSTVGSAINNPTSGGSEAAPGAGSVPGAGSGSGTGGGEVADAGATVPTLLIVRTGELSLVVPDLDAVLRDGDAAVLRSGGYVSAASRSAEDGRDSAQVTYRIPSAAWETTLAALRRLASSIVSEQLKTDEVTGQVVDLTARIANLRAAEAALQAIMARATKIGDVLDVQQQLTATRGEIEKAVADKAHLVDQASYGSLAVTYRLPDVPAPTRTPVPAKVWDPGVDVAQASGKLVAIGQTTTSVGIWLAIVGLPVGIGALVLLAVIWQMSRLAHWVVARRREAAISPGA